jgi:hypothetical protein
MFALRIDTIYLIEFLILFEALKQQIVVHQKDEVFTNIMFLNTFSPTPHVSICSLVIFLKGVNQNYHLLPTQSLVLPQQ